ncbi:hypothetical protein ElyMa_003425800 [Elysia marginata]|uniref:Uncharacterized protein n=1 Tax=Elysia marginata TaxID=1093978 RepID=A0AAV4JR89_9GAST|nr:hypothetical protein ElyMa_003425800 [Elysia marginata]
MKDSRIPLLWKTSKIVPVPKKGNVFIVMFQNIKKVVVVVVVRGVIVVVVVVVIVSFVVVVVIVVIV